MNDERKKFIYFPSLTAGAIGAGISKNLKSTNDIPCRFFSKEMPEEYHHPYFLLTAGHQYKKTNVREEWGLHKKDGILVIGDSGGYQIAHGSLKWNKEIRHNIFTWLENNSDIAMNIDIPPGYQMGTRPHFNTFNECVDVSYDNFKYFNKHQSGKTNFLNVLQGNNEHQIREWYDMAKEFDFQGWALGGATNIKKLMLKIAFMIEQKEFEKVNNNYIHILGISKISDFFMLTIIQNELNKLFNNRIQLTVDSSSPSRAAAFGGYYLFNDYYNGSIKTISFSNKVEYDSNVYLPCNCPVCKGTTFKSINGFKTDSYLIMTLHNFFKTVDSLKIVDKIVFSGNDILKESINKDLYNMLESIVSIMNHKNPVEKYKSYLPLYNKQNKLDVTSFENFFGK